MSTHGLRTLVAKLDDSCRAAAERAAAITMARGHHEVDVEHLLLALLERPDGELATICRRFDVSSDGLQRDLERELARLRTGNTRTPVFGERLPRWFEQAWLVASLDDRTARIGVVHLMLALLTDPALAQLAHRTSRLFARIDVEALKREPIVRRQVEATAPAEPAPAPDDGGAARTPSLDRYTTDLTARAREGRLDPVIGREAEIRRLIDILLRRRQNNPILTGEAGVGKTAVVEGLALRIAEGDVPAPLAAVSLRALDLGLLQAGASVKGEFEQRLHGVLDEIKRSARPVVLFVDEAHTLIGAGGAPGQGDAANLLKPALARGELRTIAATTWSEYKKYFEKDAALARRFQVVPVDEPSEPIAAAMLRGMAPLMEAHFGVRIRDAAITEAVRLSARYISGRQLPDKAIGVLDTACARVALAQSTRPAAIDDLAHGLARLDVEIDRLVQEAACRVQPSDRLDELETRRAALRGERETLAARHALERRMVDEIEALRRDLDAGAADVAPEAPRSADLAVATRPRGAAAAADPRVRLTQLEAALAQVQGRQPLVPVEVDAGAIAAVVAASTGIPLGRMLQDDLATVLALEQQLGARVIGQPQAIRAVAERVRTARAQLEDPDRPKAVFLFVGPSGVGKTETALALADLLYGGERKLVTINMSEYQEAHSVAGLKGSPPGYVGYGEGGVLTEAVRRNPYSLVLLDEVEKAHPDVLELFYQVFDKGVLDDAEGRSVDFRHCTIVLTSNVGSAQTMQACLNRSPADLPSAGALAESLRPALYKAFKPAFLGRMTVVPYYPVGDDALERIVRLKLDRIAARLQQNHRAAFCYDARLVEAVLARCTEVDTGARAVDHILNGTLLPEIASRVLARLAEGRGVQRVKASCDAGGAIKVTLR